MSAQSHEGLVLGIGMGMGMGMEESGDLVEKGGFDFPMDGMEQEWIDSLLSDFDLDFSLPLGDGEGDDFQLPLVEHTSSNSQNSDGSLTPKAGNGDGDLDHNFHSPDNHNHNHNGSGSDAEGGSVPSVSSPSPASSSDNSTVVDPRNTNAKSDFHKLNLSAPTNSFLDEEEKRKARLMRNRESAQLSRQRKKNYIDELEEKVKSANSTIAELNNTVAFLTAENIKLKHQLGAISQNPNSGTQPPMAPLPYPWPPFPAYHVVAGAVGGRVYAPGSQVPLVPIPRLKSQSQPQPAATSKGRKPSKPYATASASAEQKPSKRIKKVASVAFLGFFFFVLFLHGGTDLTFRETTVELSSGGSYLKAGGRVLTSWYGHNSTLTNMKDINHNKYRPHFDRGGKSRFVKQEMDNYVYPQNGSEPLAASLFVPRNDKLVKIDGNLIIHAVLAGEKASKASKDGKEDIVSMKRESEKNSLAIITERHRALAAARASGRNVDIQSQSHLFKGAAENQRALPSNSKSNYRNDMKSTAAERSLQQWFREGLAGPVLSSGMCTEVFRFEASPNSPVTTRGSKLVTSVSSRVENSSGGQSRNNSSGIKINGARRSGPINVLKNRRVSCAVPLLPAGSSLKDRNVKNMTDHTEKIHEDRGYQGKGKAPSSMVVSILVDPRETADEGMLSSGSLSRIFVVVLIDRVKYVTYSCVLPSKGSVPHLVRS